MSGKNKQRPDWHPKGAGEEFATCVMPGVKGGHDGLPGSHAHPVMSTSKHAPRRRKLSVEDYVQGVLEGDRATLAQAITLVESNTPAHMEMAQEVLRRLLPRAGRSVRVGVTGVPGVGKSTFIEALGCFLCERGHRVAVLAVDPSSSVTRGSILGDKTRMERLSRQPNGFIRPSPSGGTLGGVTRKSRESILVCEASGFDVILVETVGVGQSEITVRSMVDFFLLLMLTGAGDELQGIKKGIMELADALLIHKADGDNKARAGIARGEYDRALHCLAAATEGWTTRVFTGSSVSGEGIPEIWAVIEKFREITGASGAFERRRHAQTLDWMNSMVSESLRAQFDRHPAVKAVLARVRGDVLSGALPATVAARELLAAFEERLI